MEHSRLSHAAALPRPASPQLQTVPAAPACLRPPAHLQHVEEHRLHDPVLEAGAQDGQHLAVQQRGQQDAADGRHEEGNHLSGGRWGRGGGSVRGTSAAIQAAHEGSR